MTELAIRAEGLGKRYRLGSQQQRYRTLRDALVGLRTAPHRVMTAVRRTSNGNSEYIWALKDVSFEVAEGEAVGIVGRNGAGKSTLLKVLSRITEPAEGYAEVRGRVASLLEVGTGFHHELTGRENIYLNGAILGMKRSDIDRKFEQIVEFAEVPRFIDTAVKHYSSGMYLRLAFSVAAHLEPDVLLVDEVLAVGDAAFQKKCLGKMGAVAAHGRTVLFVSHNLGAVRELCQTVIVLNNGAVHFRGPVVEGLARYTESLIRQLDGPASGTGWRGIRINEQPNGSIPHLQANNPLTTEGWLDLGSDFASGRVICILADPVGSTVVHQRVRIGDVWRGTLPSGRYRVKVVLPPLWLSPGVYTLHFKFIGQQTSGAEERHLSETALVDVTGSRDGISRAMLAPSAEWRIDREERFSGQLEGAR